MYREYNANPLKNNIADCTIRAISVATGKSWDYVYEKLSDIAQAQGTMMDNRDFIIDYLDRRYDRVTAHGKVGEVAERYKDYILLITMRGHITTSIYGIIYDTFNPSDREVEYAWIIKER